jgi:hypothetical protein
MASKGYNIACVRIKYTRSRFQQIYMFAQIETSEWKLLDWTLETPKIFMQKIKNMQAELSNYVLKRRTLLTNIN